MKISRDMIDFVAVMWIGWGNPMDLAYGDFLEYMAVLWGVTENQAQEQIMAGDEDLDKLEKIVSALITHQYLPSKPKTAIRVNHNFGLRTKTEKGRIVEAISIIEEGIVPQPEKGKGSESPHEVFVSIDDPHDDNHGKYNANYPWITADIPIIDVPFLVDESPGAYVVLNHIPIRYIIGINGLPIKRFNRAIQDFY